MLKYFFILAVIIGLIICDCKRPELLQAHNRFDVEDVENEFRIKRGYAGELTDELDVYFRKYFRRTHFNGNVLVAKSGKIVYQTSVGYANLRKKTPLFPESKFQLASVSKQFTAAAIMLLEEQGRLSYNDTLQKFFPNLPYKKITVEHLLLHRSGLPNYMYFCDVYTDRETPITNKEVLDLMIKYKPKAYSKPDRKYKYSNTGYALLALIVEHVTNKPFESFLQDEIFTPLKMNNTFVFRLTQPKTLEKSYVTTGYEGWHVADPIYLDGVVGDKGVYSTTEDLLRWDQALYTNEILSQKSLEKAFSTKNNNFKDGRGYGYGFRIREFEDHKIVYHGGWWRGYNSIFVRDIDNDVTVILLGNKYNTTVNSSYHDILGITTSIVNKSNL